jgi:hypothetical protein
MPEIMKISIKHQTFISNSTIIPKLKTKRKNTYLSYIQKLRIQKITIQ